MMMYQSKTTPNYQRTKDDEEGLVAVSCRSKRSSTKTLNSNNIILAFSWFRRRRLVENWISIHHHLMVSTVLLSNNIIQG
mmetsp:Transcript_19977/g.30345  ORF Transcript_19977/g.30345 Transcript_19977/m.30345 type:complete len:80 (+) Transcript_19977:176-415(+)